MNRAELLKRFPSFRNNALLVSEVTRMSKGYFCVAGLDLALQKMIRPLQGSGHNWYIGQDRTVFRVGHVLDYVPSGARGTTMPHASEDTPLSALPSVLAALPEEDTYRLLFDAAAPSVTSAIGHRLVDNKYVEEGTQCRSLGGVQAKRKQLRFRDDGYGALRLSLSDSDGNSYDLKVTCDTLQHLFSPSDHDAEPHFGIDEANEWLDVNQSNDILILRVGFARPWDGKQNQWHPRRCYLQLNGLVCPQDNYHIFAGPPGNA